MSVRVMWLKEKKKVRGGGGNLVPGKKKGTRTLLKNKKQGLKGRKEEKTGVGGKKRKG